MMSDGKRTFAEQQAEREAVVRQRQAAVNAEIDRYLETVTYSGIPPMDAPADYEPLSKDRAALHLLIQKERLYIKALRDNWQSAPEEIRQALVLIGSYRQLGLVIADEPADSEANDGL